MRSWRSFLGVGACALALSMAAQERERFRIGTDDGYVEGYVVAGTTYPVQPGKEYHWVKAQRVHVTQGGYDGRVLDGPCAEFYPDGQLRAAGRYQFGVKHGAWKAWAADGRLLEVRRWRNGWLQGWTDIYASGGQPAVRERYRKGKLTRTEPMEAPPDSAKLERARERLAAKAARAEKAALKEQEREQRKAAVKEKKKEKPVKSRKKDNGAPAPKDPAAAPAKEGLSPDAQEVPREHPKRRTKDR